MLKNVYRDAALDYAQNRGWPVFPCSPDTKQPLTQSGFKDASADPRVIHDWWMRWPDAMIGLPTGKATGLLIIDLDPPAGEDAYKLLGRVKHAAELAAVPVCPMLLTPRGGLHLYFRYPKEPELGNRAKIIPGVDMRGEGGYVIAAPSMRKGPQARADGCENKTYYWEVDHELDSTAIPDLGAELLAFVQKRKADLAQYFPEEERRAKNDRAQAPVDVDAAKRHYCLTAMAKELEDLRQATEGGRNDQLNRAAYSIGQLVGAGGVAETVATAALTDVGIALGLSPSEVAATVRSGMTSGASSPRDLSNVGPAPHRGRRAAGSQASPAFAGDQGQPSPGGEDRALALVEECAGLDQNDTDNGKRLRLRFGCDLLVVRNVGEHYWTGKHWEREGADETWRRHAQTTARLIKSEVAQLAKGRDELHEDFEKRKKARWRFAVTSGNSSRVSGMIKEAESHVTIAPDRVDADPYAINVQNGTLRIAKERFRELDPDCPDPEVDRYIEGVRWAVRLDGHKREDYLAKITACGYDPAADCPKWLAFMQRFQPDPAVRRFLQAFHGYALTGMVGEQAFVFNYGLGANGKSTFMEALARLMGSYSQVLPAEALTGDMQRRGDQATPEFARLPGARLVRCAELQRGQSFRESTVKMLTGGEPMLVRHLHERFFEMRPTFKAIGSGNDRPSIGGVDEGIWRRIKLVPWKVTISHNERRPMERVLKDFEAEHAGILNWLIEGLLDYMENGLVIPEAIEAATEAYRSDMDPVGEFTKACVVAAEGEEVQARAMYEAYQDWCAANSVKAWTEKTFAGVMVQKGYEKTKGRVRHYQNVKLDGVPSNPERHEPGWS